MNVEEEIAALARATAWSGMPRPRTPYEMLSVEARSILEECTARGIRLGMTWHARP